MRILLGLALVLALVLSFAGVAAAEEKSVTMEGKVTCPKCDLKKEKKCYTVLVVKDGDNETVYWFDAAANKKYHGDICSGGKAGKVTGTVAEKDGKKWITVSKLEFTEK